MADPSDGPRERLRRRLTGFVDLVRSHGVPVGVGAEVDWARATSAIDLLDRDGFRAASVATLAKSPDDARAVLAAFDRYWSLPDAAVELPWAEPETTPLAPRRRAPTRPRPGPDVGKGDPSPPVAIPLGTYSASAPSAAHPLVPLTEREVRALRRGARRFRREMATYPGRRRAGSPRGGVDLRDTVRESVRHGGEWIDLRHRAPRPSRAELVVLWDVSGSMREHESRLFGLVHALESSSRRSRVFAFSTRVEEITAEVRRFGYRRAAEAVARRIDRTDGGTRIGRSLHEFSERYGRSLGRGTTLVVLSDGWDLGEADLVGDELARIARRVHRIVWVTPYTRRPGFQARVGALRSSLDQIDRLLGPEDFESPWPLRPFRP